MYKNRIKVLIIILLLPLVSLAQSRDSVAKIQALQNRIEILEEQKKLVDNRFETKSEAIDLQIDKIEQKLNSDHNVLENLIWAFGSISIVGFIALYFKLLSKTNEIAENKIENKLDSFFEDKKERFKELIHHQIEENTIKSDSKIVTLTPPDSDSEYIKSFFREMGFKNVRYKDAKPPLNFEENSDLIFINDETNSLDEEIINRLPSQVTDSVVFFYFGPKRVNIDRNKLASANFRSQIYGNLINALRYQSFI